MALEGSLVLPIFLFFMMTVFLGLEAVRFQSNVLEALHQAGNAAAFEGDSEGYIGGGSPGQKPGFRNTWILSSTPTCEYRAAGKG